MEPKPQPVLDAERLLRSLEVPRTTQERCAWAIHHEEEAAQCITALLAFQSTLGSEYETLAKLAAKLLLAIGPLLSKRPDGKHFIDDYVEGMAPRLRPAFAALKAELES